MVRDFLRIFVEATGETERSKVPTLHLVWPWYVRLKRYFEANLLDTSLVLLMKHAAAKYFRNNVQLHITIFHKIAVLMHPQLKHLKMATNQEKLKIYTEVKSYMQNFCDTSSSTEHLTPEVSLNRTQSQSQSQAMNMFMDVDSDSSDSGGETNVSAVEKEFVA